MDHRVQTFQKASQSLTSITTQPGVYLYYDDHGSVLYVGKAKNLRHRVSQYVTRDDAIGQKTNILVPQIASIETIATDSEFDALLLEATLIRKYQPKYNAIAKDDKSPLYVAITFDDLLPRILFTRKTTIDSWHPMPNWRFIAGPFQSGRVARRLMQSVRHIIPYCTQKPRDGRPCFYTHIGLCHPCPSVLANMPDRAKKRLLVREYKTNLRRISLLLSGQAKRVRGELEKSMHEAAKRMAFEEADDYKQQLSALDTLLTHTFDPSVYTDHTSEPHQIYERRLTELSHVLHRRGLHLLSLTRIECVDISAIHGQWATGSLVVFINGLPDTAEYRRFRIKGHITSNDVGMMAEVITRRFSHREWPHPDLLIVDGGKPQVTAALHALAVIPSEVEGSLSQNIPVIGLAKRYEEIVIPRGTVFTTIRLDPVSPALQLLQHIRDEAHRFAKRYHKILRTKGVMGY